MEMPSRSLAAGASKIIPLLVFVCFAGTGRAPAQCPEKRQWVPLELDSAPVGRQKHAMVYDDVRSQTVLFGGQDIVTFRGTNVIYGDTWQFDGRNWQQKFPAHSPSARFGHTMSYDAKRGVTVLFGGRGDGMSPGGGSSDEVWEWNGSDWSQVAVTGTWPGARAYHGMAYDSARGVHVLYGGTTGTSIFGDTWEYDGAARTWTLRAPPDPGPGPRIWFQLSFDAARNKTLLFGGTQDGTVQFGDTWTWDGRTGAWTQINPPIHPNARQLYTLAYDSLRQVVLLQSGARTDSTGTAINDESWEWNGSTWADLTSTYFEAYPSVGASMAYDSSLHQMLLFGGYDLLPQISILALRANWDSDYSFVDWQNSGTQNGTLSHPFQTVHQGLAAGADCSRIVISTGDYGEGALTINRPLKLEAIHGPIHIH